MKRFKKRYILTEMRKLSLFHIIIPALIILLGFFALYVIDFDSIFHPNPYINSFDAYSAYVAGEDELIVKISELKYTGYNIMKNDKVDAVYYYDLYGGKCMFYKLDMQYDSVEEIPQIINDKIISVKVTEMDGLSQNMIESFASSINWTSDGLSAITFPVIMDEREYNTNIYYVVYVLILIAIFYSLYLAAQNIIICIAPYLHPAYLRLKPYFKDVSYFEMIDMINENFDNEVIVQAERMYITDKYFINLGTLEVSIIPLEQIVLAYSHSKMYTLFGIHLHMKHTLHFCGFKNIKIHASGKQATHVTTIMDYLRENCPTIIWGHTKENIKAYKQLLATERANDKAARNQASNNKESAD